MLSIRTICTLMGALVTVAGACAPAAPPPSAGQPARAPASTSEAGPAPTTVTRAQTTGAGKTETVTVLHVPSTLFAPLYLAIEKGYLKERGIEASLDRVAAGQDAMAMAATGRVDVVVGGFGAATFNTVDRGADLRIVASMGAQPARGYPSALMVRQDLLDSGAIKGIADLKGRKIGISGGLGSAGSYWVAVKLREAGLGLKDIEVVNVGFPEMVSGLKQGALDAALPPAPFTTQIKDGKIGDFFGGPLSPGASAVGVVYGGKFIQERREVGMRFMVGLVQAARELQTDQQYYDPRNLEIYAKYTGGKPEDLKNQDRYDFHPDLRPDVETLTNMQKIFIEEGILKLAGPLPAQRWADPSFVQYAVDQLGPAKRGS